MKCQKCSINEGVEYNLHALNYSGTTSEMDNLGGGYKISTSDKYIYLSKFPYFMCDSCIAKDRLKLIKKKNKIIITGLVFLLLSFVLKSDTFFYFLHSLKPNLHFNFFNYLNIIQKTVFYLGITIAFIGLIKTLNAKKRDNSEFVYDEFMGDAYGKARNLPGVNVHTRINIKSDYRMNEIKCSD